MKYDKKKLFVLTGMLALLLCVSVINNRLSVDEGLSASAGYADHEAQEMQEHDGEVLVDSINVTELPGTSQPGAQNASGSAVAGVSGSALVTSDDVEELANTDTYFEEVRATINMDRNEILSMLTDVINETPDGAEKNNATEQKLKIIDYMNKEKVIENLIENKGFSDALVLITDSSVNVTVNKQDLAQTDIAKISDIVMRETGKKADQIVIQSKF
ncbi:SpoIIIAH-like family protein [Bacilliculturomica massiliensis]|uniref:SpoIIIAH-like family protein n=1 Tax=Bacilliculturomica massiliensis TaxID=1917867 RepID=UPI0010322827|nr:SpoIIIAH-like family protein [Bacilliculturomica massiliensis]